MRANDGSQQARGFFFFFFFFLAKGPCLWSFEWALWSEQQNRVRRTQLLNCFAMNWAADIQFRRYSPQMSLNFGNIPPSRIELILEEMPNDGHGPHFILARPLRQSLRLSNFGYRISPDVFPAYATFGPRRPCTTWIFRMPTIPRCPGLVSGISVAPFYSNYNAP